MTESYKHLFTRFLNANPDQLHFAAHSHHFWMDASRDAHIQYWDDSAQHSDHKWGHILGTILPSVQNHIAKHLTLSDPKTIAFAPNTHEFVGRLLSCLPARPSILTTDSEFHSFSRQIKRLEEDGLVSVSRIATEPFNTFPQRMTDAASTTKVDMLFFSHVFFNSGYAVPDLKRIVDAVPHDDTLIVIDGYHGFMALPTDLSAVQHRAFYMAGGYKYAMSGEGVCFLHCPPAAAPRPRNTGWYANIYALDDRQDGKVGYASDGFRFFGATFDPSGLYRLNATMTVLNNEGLSVPHIHNHIINLQNNFMGQIGSLQNKDVSNDTIMTRKGTPYRGHFLTFRTKKAKDLTAAFSDHNIITDCRDDRLRFGFGLYHDANDIDRLIDRLRPILGS